MRVWTSAERIPSFPFSTHSTSCLLPFRSTCTPYTMFPFLPPLILTHKGTVLSHSIPSHPHYSVVSLPLPTPHYPPCTCFTPPSFSPAHYPVPSFPQSRTTLSVPTSTHYIIPSVRSLNVPFFLHTYSNLSSLPTFSLHPPTHTHYAVLLPSLLHTNYSLSPFFPSPHTPDCAIPSLSCVTFCFLHRHYTLAFLSSLLPHNTHSPLLLPFSAHTHYTVLFHFPSPKLQYPCPPPH